MTYAALIAAREVDQAKLKRRTVMNITVSVWMRLHGLSLALNKTEIMVLTKKQGPTTFPVQVGNIQLVIKPAAKYLGVSWFTANCLSARRFCALPTKPPRVSLPSVGLCL